MIAGVLSQSYVRLLTVLLLRVRSHVLISIASFDIATQAKQGAAAVTSSPFVDVRQRT